MSTSSVTRLAIDAAVLAAVVDCYSYWCGYPIVDGKRCKAEPVLTASAVFDTVYSHGIPLTVARVRSALDRLVASGELEITTATIGTTEHKPGREVKAYSPAARYDLVCANGIALRNVTAKQCDDAITRYTLTNYTRVSVSDRVSG